MTTRQTALLSAFRKDEALRAFAAGLVARDWNILASQGTKKFLDQHGIPSTDVASIVGEPILGHRVVTLSREIHAGILARLDNADDMAELERIRISPIHLVYVDMYPVEEELVNPARTIESVIEKIDIGGPTLLRAAAKAGRIVVSHARHFDPVLEYVSKAQDLNPADALRFRMDLAAVAEGTVAAYAILVADFYESVGRNTFK